MSVVQYKRHSLVPRRRTTGGPRSWEIVRQPQGRGQWLATQPVLAVAKTVTQAKRIVNSIIGRS